jgi:hypothetical protein
MVWVRFNLGRRHRTLGSEAQKEKAMISKLGQILRDERGLETLEWIAMAVLIIVGVAVVAYNPGGGGLLAAVQGAIGQVTAALAAA